VAAGVDVFHILSADDASRHELTGFARLIDGKMTYPGLV
jgi:hypothetical protein